MKLLIINDQGIFGGGTENRIRTFTDLLLQQHPSTEIHILQKIPTTIPEAYLKNPRYFFHILKNRTSSYWKTRRLIAKHNIDLVQVHNLLLIQPYAVLAAKHTRVPVVWWAHDYWLLCAKRSFIDPFHAMHAQLCYTPKQGHTNQCMSFKTRIKYRIWQWAMNHASLAIAPAKILQDIHEREGLLKRKWNVVVPWIDEAYFVRTSTEKKIQRKNTPFTLLYVGSLIEFKGAWVAAKALKQIIKKFPNVQLVFVGSEQEPESKYRKEIEKICAADGTSHCLVFLGKKNKEEIRQLHTQATLYLCPTVCMESFGLNWAEAMASGCPVIASAIGSIPAYVHDGENGLLFPPRDDCGLAEKVIALLSHPKKRALLALHGKKFAEQYFTVERATNDILRLYNTLLSNK